MKRILVFLLLLFPLLLSAQKSITYEQAFNGKGEKLFKSLPYILNWIDKDSYLMFKDNKAILFDARNRKSRSYLNESCKKYSSLILGRRNSDINFKKKCSVWADGKNLVFVDLSSGTKKEIAVGVDKIKNPSFSPDCKKVAFTSKGNLYVLDIKSTQVKALTNDGNENILNGYASWVYYEEILGRASNYKAFYWSLDSSKIVFLRFDQRKIPVFTIVSSKGDYGLVEKQFYPKAGYPNPIVSIAYVDVTSGKLHKIDKAFEEDAYLTFPVWSKNSQSFYYQYLNRDQNDFKIYKYSLKNNKSRVAYEEKNKTWINFKIPVEQFRVLDNDSFLFLSDKSGWNHLYMKKGKKVKALTKGSWSVINIKALSKNKKTVYLTASKEKSINIDLYSVGLKNGKIKRLTKGDGVHRVMVSPQGNFFIDTFSSLNTPFQKRLFDSKGKIIKDYGTSVTKKFKDYNLGKRELFYVKTKDGFKLPVIWHLPADFDSSKKYPVILQIYGGPERKGVYNSFSRGLYNSYLTQLGIIVVKVDHRGAGHHGKKGMDYMHRNLGKWELNDYEAVIDFLREKKFIDKDKIGITGGSYGGYITSLALCKAPSYFNYGIADFSVMDWKLYDSVYTERYMDTPEQNPQGYKDSSVLNHIDTYKGGLRVTHGTMDDNVHMQNTMQFVNAVQISDKPFEIMIYPGGKHGYSYKKRGFYIKDNINFWLKVFFDKKLD